jgi:hypothetical protein
MYIYVATNEEYNAYGKIPKTKSLASFVFRCIFLSFPLFYS